MLRRWKGLAKDCLNRTYLKEACGAGVKASCRRSTVDSVSWVLNAICSWGAGQSFWL